MKDVTSSKLMLLTAFSPMSLQLCQAFTTVPCYNHPTLTCAHSSSGSFSSTTAGMMALKSSARSDDDNNDDEQQPPQDRLLLSKEDIQQQMAQLRSKYPTTEADYLAAAHARNAARVTSTGRQATDADWQSMATEKEQKYGKQDDWEAAQKDAGNTADSQILLPLEMTEEGSFDEDDEEPKLMLF